MRFVKQVVFEDETKLKGIPPDDCSKIMIWRLYFSGETSTINHLQTTALDATQQEITNKRHQEILKDEKRKSEINQWSNCDPINRCQFFISFYRVFLL